MDGGNDVGPDASDAFVDTADAAMDAGTQTPECLAKNGTEYRISLIGAGFGAYEGRNLVAVTTDTEFNPCRASGSTQICEGAFQIELVNLSLALYPNIDAFVDLDGDGNCDQSWRCPPRDGYRCVTVPDFRCEPIPPPSDGGTNDSGV